MRRLTIFMAFLLMVCNFALHAQGVQIKGKVTSAEDGSALPGASVVVKGTNVATVTDAEGNYILNVPSGAASIFVSFVGMKTQEALIAGQTTIDIALQPDIVGMEEVVVTAIGIKRSEKSLGYSATTVSSDELTQTRNSSLMNSLQGKVAGVNISSASGAPGSATKVIIRGFSSLTQNNQPLYVVDGIPVNNTTNSFYADGNDVSRTQDFGNRANDINPDDIESVTILKGAAAALYGSRAANGVILITTKRGNKADRLKVEYNGSASMSEPLMLPQLQNWYGQGWNGVFKYEENGSWGPKFDNKLRLWGNKVDNSQKLKPYSALENNLRDFFETGRAYNNSVSISGAKDNTDFYLSYGNVSDDGIVPTNADSYDRNTFSLKGSYTGSKLSASASANYIKKKQKTITQGQGAADGGATLYQDIMQIPRDISIVELKDYKSKFNNIDNYFTPYAENPYFIINENGNNWNEDRLVSSISLDYKLASWLNATYRVGADVANSQLQDWGAIAENSIGSINETRGRNPIVGRVNEQVNFDYQLNTDLILNGDFKFSDYSLNAFVGYNTNERFDRQLYTYVTDLDVPGYYNIKNSSVSPISQTLEHKRRLYGIYSQAELGFKEYMYLTISARNDWSSTLPKDNKSFFYPGVSLSFVLSEAVPSLKDIVPFAKIRASYSKTGNDASPYSVYSVYSPGSVYAYFGNMEFPLGGVNGFEIFNQIGNLKLQPEMSYEKEIGIDFRFLNNRVGIDASYYDKRTEDQIMSVPLSSASGYTLQVSNIGTIGNKGFEVLLNLVPIKLKDFEWNIGLNYTRNRSNVIELSESLKDGYLINSAYDVDFLAKIGKPLGVFEGPDYERDSKGRIVVNAQGIPVSAAEKVEYGNSEADYRLGIKNEFTFKGLTLGGNIDIRQGGLMYTYTSDINYFVGNATQTTYNDRQPFVVPNSVQEVGTDKNGDPIYAENSTPIAMKDFSDYYNNNTNRPLSRESLVDRSFVKLRDLYISYELPKKWFTKLSLSSVNVGLIGKNLLLWTAKDNNFVDPESSTWGSDLESEFGEFAVGPSIRSYSVSLKITY